MAAESIQLLEQGFQAVLATESAALPGGGAAPGSREAFQAIQRGVNKANNQRAAMDNFLVDVPVEHRSHLLGFVVDFAKAVPMYKRQASVLLTSLLKAPGWADTVRAYEGLLRKLQDSDLGVEIPAMGEPATQPAAPQPPPSQEAAADSPSDAAEGALSLPSVRLADAERGEEQRRAEASALMQREAEAAAGETRRQLRAALEAIAKLGYEVENKDKAVGALGSLCRAVNRSHWDHEKRKAVSNDPDASPNAILQREASLRPSAGSSATPQRMSSGASVLGAEDPLVEAMQGLSWDPIQVMKFLFSIQKMYTLHRNRATSVATMMVQISPVCCETVRADAFLAAWMGVVRTNVDALNSISYGLASSLRWAAWDLSWHHAHLRRRDQAAADRHLSLFAARQREVLSSMELPRSSLEPLLSAAEAAARHTAQIRFPDESKRKGLMGNIMGALGLVGDEGPLKDEFHKLCDEAEATGALSKDLAYNLRWMIWNLAWYGANRVKGLCFGNDATDSLVRAERHFAACYRREAAQWRGVNLGGWFLLEPGPCSNFWTGLPPEAQAAACEWGCSEALGPAAAEKLLTEHRNAYFTREDFQRMKAAGVTHVRLPFGAWCVAGPRPGEPYVGPCLDALDRALDQLEDAGLMVLLDLHGPVGGINGEPPTGRQDGSWQPAFFDTAASLAVLKTVAERYAGRICVCGLGVANEPAEVISGKDLVQYYEDSIRIIRLAGMRPGQVTVFLPIFTERRAKEFLTYWEEGYPKYQDCVFDLHFYQCFGASWTLLPLSMQLTKAKERVQLLKTLPACSVTEWSLALPPMALRGLNPEGQKKAWKDFAQAQLEAYEEGATHGWFFWTWKDGNHITWSMRDCLEQGLLQLPAPTP